MLNLIVVSVDCTRYDREKSVQFVQIKILIIIIKNNNNNKFLIKTEREPMDTVTTTAADDVERVVKEIINWKAPEPDEIQNYWHRKPISNSTKVPPS